MRFIHQTSTDPAFNLAAEEWLLRHTREDVFMLWRNAKAVIVGRNQNTISEINEAFVRKNGVSVIRRLTGGGAVFHDLGNINFTIIALNNDTETLDFQRFAKPVLAALQSMGIPCSFNGRNDLVIEDRKFSGNAQHLWKGRVLHHGTLLYASKMEDLSGALKIHPEKYRDKAVKSVRARVTNIASHLPESMEITEFMGRLMARMAGEEGVRVENALSGEEILAVNELAKEKYRSWDWNYGRSPAYAFAWRTRTPGGVLDVRMDVQDGVIQGIRIFGDYFGVRDVSELEDRLKGCRHDRIALAERLQGVVLDDYFQHVEEETFLDCLF
jgi:lipoate-protein ligase A